MKRFHSLDAMRAILMLIGVYFHLAHAYTPFYTGWARNQETTSMFFGFFILSSNSFRMHAFFLIAGFFGALLYERKGARAMIENRFKRIFLPLIVMIWPISISIRFSQEFANYQLKGMSFTDSITNSISIFKSLEILPWSTQHLWFLNFLFFMSFFAFLTKYFFNQSNKEDNQRVGKIGKVIALLFSKQWLVTISFCFLYGTLMALMGKHKAQGFDNWWEWLWFFYPNGVKTFIAFGFFYFFGWHMYYQRSLLDILSVKKLFFLLVIFVIILTPANYYLWRYLDSPYEEQSDFFEEHAEKYRPERDVTFNVDMSQFDFSKFEKESSKFRGVFLLGTFNNYCSDCDKMEDEDGDLVYTKTVKVRKGFHKFIFSVNGWERTSGPKPDSDCDAAPGFKDNIYALEVLDQSVVLDPVCWQRDCNDCSGNQVYDLSLSYVENLKRMLIRNGFIFLFNFMIPCFIILILSLFLKFFNAESKIMRYISDASYWVYIIHLPLTHFVPGLFHQNNMNVFIKFSVSSIIITFLCFASYHYLIRSTFIGEFLNGKKYST